MSMKKTILKTLSKLTLVIFLLLGASMLNTCTAPEVNKDVIKNEVKFDISKFYFNKYIEFKVVDSTRSIHRVVYDNGNIQVYGDVIRIKTTQQEVTYIINERTYDEDTQIYEFYSENTIIEFDVVNKTMTTYEEDGSGIVYKINSTITSNW